ncbi:MAG: hypothetical protein V1837_06650 [Candidatus Woesearchaeota archaeon]
MPKFRGFEEVYDSCLTKGLIKDLTETNIDKIKTLLENANTNVSSANIIKKSISIKAKEWMNVYTLHYEALRMVAEVLLRIKGVYSENHQCLFSALLAKYPELDLDWGFFEKIRTKRHGANYYGEMVSYEDWKEIEVQATLYLSTLKKEAENQIKPAKG